MTVISEIAVSQEITKAPTDDVNVKLFLSHFDGFLGRKSRVSISHAITGDDGGNQGGMGR